MKFRWIVFVGALAAVGSATMVEIAGQSTNPKAVAGYVPPRTAWGEPDLQGIWRALDINTPFERPLALGTKAEYTPEEIAARLKRMQEVMESRCAGNMTSRGFRAQPNYNSIHGCTDDDMRLLVPHRTSALVNPPNGRMPPWTMQQVKFWEEREKLTAGRGETDDTQDMDITGRCLRVPAGTGSMGGSNITLPPEEVARRKAILDSKKVIDVGEGFNDVDGATGGPGNTETYAKRILQAPGYFAILQDEGGEYRMIPVDGRPALGPKIKQYLGEARGHWEGDTLVAEVTGVRFISMVIPNFGIGYIGNGETLKVTQRLTRISPDVIEERVTVSDPSTWTQPFTFVRDLTRDDSFKFTQVVCQENTKDLGNSLAHARADEALSLEYGETSRENRVKIFEERKAEAIAAEANKQKR